MTINSSIVRSYLASDMQKIKEFRREDQAKPHAVEGVLSKLLCTQFVQQRPQLTKFFTAVRTGFVEAYRRTSSLRNHR